MNYGRLELFNDLKTVIYSQVKSMLNEMYNCYWLSLKVRLKKRDIFILKWDSRNFETLIY